jgi:hypothetical protein
MQLGVWTLGEAGAAYDPPAFQCLRNGIHVGGGYAAEYLYWNKAVYVTYINRWWAWDGVAWTEVASPIPVPPPPPPPDPIDPGPADESWESQKKGAVLALKLDGTDPAFPVVKGEWGRDQFGMTAQGNKPYFDGGMLRFDDTEGHSQGGAGMVFLNAPRDAGPGDEIRFRWRYKMDRVSWETLWRQATTPDGGKTWFPTNDPTAAKLAIFGPRNTQSSGADKIVMQLWADENFPFLYTYWAGGLTRNLITQQPDGDFVLQAGRACMWSSAGTTPGKTVPRNCIGFAPDTVYDSEIIVRITETVVKNYLPPHFSENYRADGQLCEIEGWLNPVGAPRQRWFGPSEEVLSLGQKLGQFWAGPFRTMQSPLQKFGKASCWYGRLTVHINKIGAVVDPLPVPDPIPEPTPIPVPSGLPRWRKELKPYVPTNIGGMPSSAPGMIATWDKENGRWSWQFCVIDGAWCAQAIDHKTGKEYFGRGAGHAVEALQVGVYGVDPMQEAIKYFVEKESVDYTKWTRAQNDPPNEHLPNGDPISAHTYFHNIHARGTPWGEIIFWPYAAATGFASGESFSGDVYRFDQKAYIPFGKGVPKMPVDVVNYPEYSKGVFAKDERTNILHCMSRRGYYLKLDMNKMEAWEPFPHKLTDGWGHGACSGTIDEKRNMMITASAHGGGCGRLDLDTREYSLLKLTGDTHLWRDGAGAVIEWIPELPDEYWFFLGGAFCTINANTGVIKYVASLPLGRDGFAGRFRWNRATKCIIYHPGFQQDTWAIAP